MEQWSLIILQHFTTRVYESLERLQTDYIDLLYIHSPDKETPKSEAVGAIQELKEKGAIRAIGVLDFSEAQLKEANQDGYVNVVQDEYGLINREMEKRLFPYTREHHISFVPFSPFASGLLAGKYTKDMVFPEGDLHTRKAHFQGKAYIQNLQKVEQLRDIAAEKEVEIDNLVLAWYLTQDAIDVLIPAAKRSDQGVDKLKTLQITLPEDEIVAIDHVFS